MGNLSARQINGLEIANKSVTRQVLKMIPLAIILIILNIAIAVISPNQKFDWMNYMSAGMLIEAIIFWMMRR